MGEMSDREKTRNRIFRTLVETEEPLSIREIARRLHLSASLTHHHIDRLSKQGVLIREEGGRGEVYYRLQPIFEGDHEDTLAHIEALEKRIIDPTPHKLAQCLTLFIEVMTES